MGEVADGNGIVLFVRRVSHHAVAATRLAILGLMDLALRANTPTEAIEQFVAHCLWTFDGCGRDFRIAASVQVAHFFNTEVSVGIGQTDPVVGEFSYQFFDVHDSPQLSFFRFLWQGSEEDWDAFSSVARRGSSIFYVPPLRVGDFQGIGVYRPMRSMKPDIELWVPEGSAQHEAPRSPLIGSMSPPGYPSARLRPRRAGLRFTRQC